MGLRSEVTDFQGTEDDRGATSLNMADWRPRWAACDGFSPTSCPDAACTFIILQRVGSGDGLIGLTCQTGIEGMGAERISAVTHLNSLGPQAQRYTPPIRSYMC